MSQLLLDAAGRRRSPATLPGFHAGRPPRNKGRRYPADPPTVEEIVAVMRYGGDGLHGRRLRGLIVVLWHAGLRIHEALALGEADLDRRRGSLLVRRGKGGRRREVGMDEWTWEQLQPWLDARTDLPVGPLFSSSPDRPADARGQTPQCAPSCATSLHGQASVGASPRTSSATSTPSRWRARRAADRHPTAARAHQPRCHLDLPPRHRQRRDHRRRPRLRDGCSLSKVLLFAFHRRQGWRRR